MQHLQPNTTLQGGKYRIVRVLGQGGFGITYLAIQLSLQRQVAVKEFFMKDLCGRGDDTRTVETPSTGSSKLVELYRKKFVKEAHNLARLNHPNIISVIEVFEENGTVYYSMPYLSGGSLYDYVKKHGALSEKEAMKYIRQIAKALKYMHEDVHICHYDVKPSNILLDDKGNAVLIDFGISKNYDASGHETSTTPIGLSEGYAPIEQYQQNIAEFSPVSDVYALGATLYFLLHGRRPVSAVHRASGTHLILANNLSQATKDVIILSMKISKRERANSVDVFLGTMGNLSESPTKDNSHSDFEEETVTSKSVVDLEREALAYYDKNDIKILNQYGFFKQKKKRQASIIWASCLISFFLFIFLAFLLIEYQGWDHGGFGGAIIYPMAIMCGVIPGIYIGPALMGLRDKSQFNELAENIKKQFVSDYVSKNINKQSRLQK